MIIDKRSSVTVTSQSHGFEKGDLITVMVTRYSLSEKVIAFFVGIFYWNRLPRPFKNFIKTGITKHEISSVTETTFTITEP